MKLKEYLLKKRMDPAEFAVKCKIAVSTIYRILRGSPMYMKTAKIIEKHTNHEVTVEELMDLDGPTI